MNRFQILLGAALSCFGAFGTKRELYLYVYRSVLRSIQAELLPERSGFFAALIVPFPHETKLQFFQAEPGKKLYNIGVNPVDNFALLSQADLVSISKTGFLR